MYRFLWGKFKLRTEEKMNTNMRGKRLLNLVMAVALSITLGEKLFEPSLSSDESAPLPLFELSAISSSSVESVSFAESEVSASSDESVLLAESDAFASSASSALLA